MRRDTFLKSLAAMAATGPAAVGLGCPNVKMMIPANPGGGWDTTAARWARPDGRQAGRHGDFDNKGGAAGALGLAQFVNGSRATRTP
jgi:putative tricarboxylic transport membrane protein